MKKSAPRKRVICGDPSCNRPADDRYSFLLTHILLGGERMRYSFCTPEHQERIRPWLERRQMIWVSDEAEHENESE